MSQRNEPPADVYDLLRRILNCNWNQLADHLGVTPTTLRTWRKEGAGANGTQRLHQLFHSTLARCDCEWIGIQFLNFDHIRTINGKR